MFAEFFYIEQRQGIMHVPKKRGFGFFLKKSGFHLS